MNKIQEIYEYLLNLYGHQGWWPLVEVKGTNPTKTGSISGYHPQDYTYPRNKNQKFEIICGAILTQNTNWPNVEKAIVNINALTKFDPEKLLELDEEILKDAIRPAGYFNQKYKKIKLVTEFFISLDGEIPTRNQLLDIWGIGPETADAILLYAYKQREFVADTYTKRVLLSLGLIQENWGYDDIKRFLENNLKKDYKLYQEFHALIVEHAKRQKPLKHQKS